MGQTTEFAASSLVVRQAARKTARGLNGEMGRGTNPLPIRYSSASNSNYLFCVISRSCFTNDIHPDLAWVGHLVLDLAGDIFSKDM